MDVFLSSFHSSVGSYFLFSCCLALPSGKVCRLWKTNPLLSLVRVHVIIFFFYFALCTDTGRSGEAKMAKWNKPVALPIIVHTFVKKMTIAGFGHRRNQQMALVQSRRGTGRRDFISLFYGFLRTSLFQDQEHPRRCANRSVRLTTSHTQMRFYH